MADDKGMIRPMRVQSIALAVLFPLIGCHGYALAHDESAIQDTHKTFTIQQPTPGVRFTPTSDPDIAYDGTTGQLCRTRVPEKGEEAREPNCATIYSFARPTQAAVPKPD